jgi:gliding motility-associated-like protein
LAVADVSDTGFDSAVFLKEGSFGISGSLIDAIVANPAPTLGNNSMLEGCVDAEFIVHPPNCQSEPLEITLYTTGTATSGVDYEGIPSTIILNNEDVSIPITSIIDSNIEGIEDITVYFVYLNNESVLDTAQATLNLVDYIAPELVVEDVNICGAPATATANITAGFAPYTYNWSSGSTSAQEEFTFGSEGPYSLVVTDYCGTELSDSFTVFEPDPFFVVQPEEICLYNASDTLAFGGGLPYTFIYNDDTLDVSTGPIASTTIPGIYDIVISDQCGSSGVVTIVAVPCETKIPNVFTPNEDGINDTFVITGIEQFPNSALTIWNRWGKVVYETSGYNNSWTAKDEADGIFYYVLQRSDGQNFEGYVHRLGEKP